MIKGETDRNIITTGITAYPCFSTSVAIFKRFVQNIAENDETENQTTCKQRELRISGVVLES